MGAPGSYLCMVWRSLSLSFFFSKYILSAPPCAGAGDTAVNKSDTSQHDYCHSSNLNAEWVHMNTLLQINKINKQISEWKKALPSPMTGVCRELRLMISVVLCT